MLLETVNVVGFDETGPRLTPDGLTMYFGSNRPGTLGRHDVFVVTRPSRDAGWSSPSAVVELSTSEDEGSISVTTDGLGLVLSRDAGSGEDLFEATRADASTAWPAPTPIAELNTTGIDSTPALTGDGLTIVFASDRAGGLGERDLWEARRSAVDEPFGEPYNLSELNTSSDESSPYLSTDGRIIHFDSRRSGGSEIYRSTR